MTSSEALKKLDKIEAKQTRATRMNGTYLSEISKCISVLMEADILNPITVDEIHEMDKQTASFDYDPPQLSDWILGTL